MLAFLLVIRGLMVYSFKVGGNGTMPKSIKAVRFGGYIHVMGVLSQVCGTIRNSRPYHLIFALPSGQAQRGLYSPSYLKDHRFPRHPDRFSRSVRL
jgi:hypothetical protein